MTREESIEIFREWINEGFPFDGGYAAEELDEDEKEALDMAIQALSQEPICDRDCEHCTWTECPIEPCDDAISRQTVLKIIDGWYEQNRDTENIEDLIVLITYMDSVRPQEPIPEQWQELKETILEMRDNDGTGTQQEVCKFLANYMAVLEKQMVEPQERSE